jgi:hypothetical protein
VSPTAPDRTAARLIALCQADLTITMSCLPTGFNVSIADLRLRCAPVAFYTDHNGDASVTLELSLSSAEAYLEHPPCPRPPKSKEGTHE